MKKSNVILTVVALAASAVLLWLWYYLGFNNVDSPLDLVMSVIWWVIVVAGVALVAKAESTRRQNVRTAYVGDGRLYNSESGLLTLGAGASATDSVAAVLAGLDYGFDRVAGPDPDDEEQPIKWSHVVRTEKYEPARNDEGERRGETWEGEVVVVATGNKVPFSSREELARIIG